MRKSTIALLNEALIVLLSAAACPAAVTPSKALTYGRDSEGPWWARQTAPDPDGRLRMDARPWWPRAAALEPGAAFLVEAEGPAKGRMLVRRERLTTRSGKELDAIVWVIDDDADGSLAAGGDTDSDCYVVDYARDGTVDRMVDYIDNDADDDPDEMDIRYFTDSRLDYVWFGLDLDDDSAMWSLRGYEYGGPSFFEADPYGNGMIFMNKLNPEDGTFSPISECPFAFYDTDADRYSEVVARVSAVPLEYDVDAHPDYANTSFSLPWNRRMEQMGIVNIRYGFDIDNASSAQTPLHYEMGFNMVGATPYRFPEMTHYNPNRRPPQETCVIPWHSMRKIAETFEARQTGFSWHENFDDTVSIGYADHKQNDYRWEGVFWIWERRFMENTGGPCQKWNVRREWTAATTTTRRLYYSDVDKRIHLFGAEEGWLQVGNFAGTGPLGEIRMFDTDRNGYFDRWEVYMADRPEPVRVSTVRDERARPLQLDLDALARTYTENILPEAMAANRRLMAAMTALHPFEVPEGLRRAAHIGSPNFRRYALDVTREIQYQDLRSRLMDLANRILEKRTVNDLRRIERAKLDKTANSQTAWKLIRALTELDAAYGQGDFKKACDLTGEIAKIQRVLSNQ
jgi:hypothetical protein